MEKLKEILLSKKAKTFYWQTLNGVIGILIVGLGDMNYTYIPLIIAGLNTITKHINKTYLTK